VRLVLYISAGLILLSYLLTFIVRKIALKHSLLDIPNERSSHEIPTPRGGGVAIVMSWFLGISLLWYFKLLDTNLFLALLCGIILAIVSFIDDVFTLPPYIRLIAQFLSALLALFFIKDISPVSISGLNIGNNFFLYTVALIGIVWFINLFNFLDGIDGYASLEAIAVSLALFLFTQDTLNIILIATVVGFLIWNWPKAKIFMGDIGSTQLGFILAITGIWYHNEQLLSILHWLMLTSLFWFDASLTLFRRWRNREKLSVAHRKHVYQRAVQSGLSHRETILYSLLINASIVILVMLSRKFPNLLIPVFVLDIMILYTITVTVDRKVPFR